MFILYLVVSLHRLDGEEKGKRRLSSVEIEENLGEYGYHEGSGNADGDFDVNGDVDFDVEFLPGHHVLVAS